MSASAFPLPFGLCPTFLIRIGVATPVLCIGSDDMGQIADPDGWRIVCTFVLSGDSPAILGGPVEVSLGPRWCVYTLLARSLCSGPRL